MILFTFIFLQIVCFLFSIFFKKVFNLTILSFVISQFITLTIFIFLIDEYEKVLEKKIILLLAFIIFMQLYHYIYFTFAKGFSSRILERAVSAQYKKEVINSFSKKLIIKERMSYLINRGFIKKISGKLHLTFLGMCINFLHKNFCKILKIKSGGF